MPKKRRKTFIKEWRVYRRFTQEALAEKIDMTGPNLSLIERGLQNYTQETLEGLAIALECEPADLLTRAPADPEGLWKIWDDAAPEQRRQIVDLAKVVTRRTGT